MPTNYNGLIEQIIRQQLDMQSQQQRLEIERERAKLKQQQQQQGSGQQQNPQQGYDMYKQMTATPAASTTAAPSADASAQVGGFGAAAPEAFTPAASASPEGMAIGADLGYGGGEAGSVGIGAGGTTAGLVGAALALGHLMSNNTDRNFEGVKTNDIFAGHPNTNPFSSWIYQKLGMDAPAAGEKLDADLLSGNTGKSGVFQSAPLYFQHLMEPWTEGERMTIDKVLPEKYAKPVKYILDPVGSLIRSIF